MTKQQLPDWFNGELYEEGDIVKNRNSKESVELNNVELSMYDFVIGSIYSLEMEQGSKKELDMLKDGLEWFKANNSAAYKMLLSQTKHIKL